MNLNDNWRELNYRWRAGWATAAVKFGSRPYQTLLVPHGRPGWSLYWDAVELAGVFRRAGARVSGYALPQYVKHQCVFYTSRRILYDDRLLADGRQRVAFPYYHGLPGSGNEEFDRVFQQLCKNHARVARIQVTHRQMLEVVLASGIAPEKVKQIPIGIALENFPCSTPELVKRWREKYQLPQQAFIVGSLQKDGNGWQDGATPKLIKGPDVFLKAIGALKARIPELYVLLSGPARGYVMNGLNALGVPYKHVYLAEYRDIYQLFQACDLYLIASRQEGGPKAVLESMASGTALVSTRVGQATDLIENGRNGFLADVEDDEALAGCALRLYEDSALLAQFRRQGRQTAEANSFEALTPRWKDFLTGYYWD